MKINKTTSFLTKNSYEIESKALSELIDTSKFENGNNLYLVSYSNKTEISGEFNSNNVLTSENIVSKAVLDKVINEPHKYFEYIKDNTTNPFMYLVKKGFTEFVSKMGLHGQLSPLYKQENKTMNDFIEKDCFSNAKNKDYEFVQFVKNKNDLKVFLNKEGEFFLEPMIFNYISANLDNGTYHLDDLVSYLATRNDVAFITGVERYSTTQALLKCPLNGSEKEISKIIEDIPGYNSHEGSDETINLVYYPTPDVISKIMDWKVSESKKTMWNLENYIIREILDCENFSKKQIVIEDSHIPKRKFKS
jgi:hypothetical protein